MPEATERLSHGEPTYFVNKKIFAMFANNHHDDGHVAVWVSAPPVLRPPSSTNRPRNTPPPYVGVLGWVGIELDNIDNEELVSHIPEAWRLVASKSVKAAGEELAFRPGSPAARR